MDQQLHANKTLPNHGYASMNTISLVANFILLVGVLITTIFAASTVIISGGIITNIKSRFATYALQSNVWEKMKATTPINKSKA